MKWSWRIGKIAGIDVYMHATFLILLAWVGIAHYLPRNSLSDAVSGVAFIVMLFGIVVLHELGHALTARRFGIRTRDITLLPIGGVARLERMPEDPKQELLVALAGPAVNVALALLFLPFAWSSISLHDLGGTGLIGGSLLVSLVWINVVLAVFNLLPAFPMDGGRVLRASLAMRMDHVRATQVAASVGQGMALLFGFIGLFTNPFLVFIALFVWVGAAGEAAMAQMHSAMGGIPVSRAMITEFHELSSRDSLQPAVDHVLAGFQHDFPVVDDDRLAGVLTQKDLMKALARDGRDGTVARAMHSEFETVHPSEMLESAFRRLQTCRCHSLPVVADGRLVGILTMENVGEFIRIQSALEQSRRERRRINAPRPSSA